MGKRSRRREKPKKAAGGSSSSGAGSDERAAELAAYAARFAEQLNFPAAADLYRRAVQLKPDDVELLDGLGEVLVTMGENDEAKAVLFHSIELAPDNGYQKYLNLGQICEGEDVVRAVSKGVEIMREEGKNAEQRGDHSTARQLAREIARALCSLAEYYMTDNSLQPEVADQYCEATLQEAMATDHENPEVLQCYVNMYLNQGNSAKAMEMMQRCLQACSSLQPEEIPFDFRVETAKCLIELKDTTNAAAILNALIQEDDEAADVFFLLGTCYKIENRAAEAVEALEAAKELVEGGEYSDDLVHRIDTALAELKVQ